MSWFPESKDHLPLTWWNRMPVYLAAILAAVGLVSMIVTSIVKAAVPEIALWTVFTYEGLVLNYQVWTVLTYVLYNPPSIWLVIGTFLLWRFGQEVERHLGRRAFVKLVVLLLLTPPVLITIIGALNIFPWFAAGIEDLELGVFLAFVTLYPRAQLSVIITTVPAWLMAVVIVGVRALQFLSDRAWGGLIVLAGIVLVAYAFITYFQGKWTLRTLGSKLRSKRLPGSSRGSSKSSRDTELTVLPPYREDREETERGHRSDAEKVDAILEKISQKGMQSLTAAERKLLEKASERLKKG
jgi:hypothetical protein